MRELLGGYGTVFQSCDRLGGRFEPQDYSARRKYLINQLVINLVAGARFVFRTPLILLMLSCGEPALRKGRSAPYTRLISVNPGIPGPSRHQPGSRILGSRRRPRRHG